jgi:hypothetical protein
MAIVGLDGGIHCEAAEQERARRRQCLGGVAREITW